jgi:hypothetical protein
MAAYDEHNTTISRDLGQLKHENALFHSGTLPPLDDRLSEAEHGLNYTHQQLHAAH